MRPRCAIGSTMVIVSCSSYSLFRVASSLYHHLLSSSSSSRLLCQVRCFLHSETPNPSSIDIYAHLLNKYDNHNKNNSDQLLDLNHHHHHHHHHHQKKIHAQLVVNGFYAEDDYVIAKLIDYLFTTRRPQLASLLFNWKKRRRRSSSSRSPDHNHQHSAARLWTSMIRGYSCCSSCFPGSSRESILLYVEMRHQGFYPNNFILPFALKSCGALKAIREAYQLHTDVLKLGFLSNVYVQTALLDMYLKCGNIDIAKQVFDNMRVKSVVSWTALVAGFCRHGLLDQAQKIFHEMPIRNVVTWNVMIDGLARYGALQTAQWYFEHMPEPNTVTLTIMLGGYSRAGDADKARFIFDRMSDREVITWTAMMTCYVQNGKPAEAIKLFHQMLEADMKLDRVTILSIISAVSQMGSLHLCAWAENHITEAGFSSDLHVLNAAINMYVQCGSIAKAFEIFQKMPKKDVISFNSMITGYATHGDAKQAFSLFLMMTQNNVRPNSITFISLLSACAHRGLVEEGRRYFQMLLDVGYVELKSEHYACMVDLLGRAGYLDEAHNLILQMPIKSKASTWGALLGACKIHGNIDLAEVVAQRLFEMEPENSGNYAVLANMYADKRMWDSAASVRKLMKEKSLLKTPGSSWAEVSNALVWNPISV